VVATNAVLPDNQHAELASNAVTTSGPEFAERSELAPAQEIPTPQGQREEPGHGAEETVHPVAEKAAEEHVAQEAPYTEPMVPDAITVQGQSAVAGDMAEKRDSDLAASTAAAWASWRQIRETAQPAPAAEGRIPSDDEFGSSSVSASAAMAAAAGAERAPDGTPGADSDDPAAIASIVDSVLADLRPKIVEEISRKLGKKK
jgi:hypothetical protein